MSEKEQEASSPTPSATSSDSAERSEQELLSQRAESEEEQAALTQMLREIQKQPSGSLPRGIRNLGLGLAAICFVALVLLVVVLIQDVPFATRVYGPQTLHPGSHACLRIALFEPEKTRFLNDIQGSIWLLGQRRKVRLFSGKSPGKVLLANVLVPKWPPGPYKLRFSISGPRGKETFTRPIQLTTDADHASSYIRESSQHDWQPPAPRGGFRYKLFTAGRGLVADLSNTVYLRVETRTAQLPLPATKKAPKAAPKVPFSARPHPPRRQALIAPATRPIGRAVSAPTSRPPRSMMRHATPPTTQASNKSGSERALQTSRLIPSHARRPTPPRFHSPPPSHGRRLLQPFGRPSAPPHPPRSSRWHAPKQPVQVTIFDGRQKLGPFRTDAQGMLRFSYIPQLFQVEWQIKLRQGSHEATFQQLLKPEGYQLVLSLQHALFSPGAPIHVRVDSLQRRGTMHFDLVQRGRRIWAQHIPFREGKCLATLHPPKTLTGLASLQVYTEFYYPGEIYDSRLVYFGHTTPRQLLQALSLHLSRRGDGMRVMELDSFTQPLPKTPREFDRWSRRLLAFAKARFVPPNLFYDSQKARHARLRSFQHKFRNRVLFGLGALGGLVLLGLFGWLTWGYRRDHLALRAAEREDDEIDEIKTRGMPWLIGFLITLLLIFGCIIYLFWAMKWTYDNL